MNPDSLLEKIARLNPLQKQALIKLGLKTVRDLLFYLPSRYNLSGQYRNIGDLKNGDEAIIYGQVLKTEIKKAHFKKIPMAEATIADDSGKLKILWFHQAYLAKKLIVGNYYQLSGKISERNGNLTLINPLIGTDTSWYNKEQSIFTNSETKTAIFDQQLIPIYSESRGITSGWFYYHIQKLLTAEILDQIVDPLPANLLKQFNLPSLKTALIWVHTPHKEADAKSARKRFAFEEVFFIQLERLIGKNEYQANPSFSFSPKQKDLKLFLDRFPFKLTKAQKRSVGEILADFKLERPMTRLLEGDVGSGKTMVAAAAAFAAVSAGLEVAYMAPTEILARQHFESFIKYFEHLKVQVGLLTGSECRKFPSKISPREHTHISRPQLLKWVAEGQIPILVGTQALIQKTVKFRNLALVIIDEQHRFGVMQRAKLVRGHNADLTRTDADNKTADHLLYEDLSYKIREIIFKVKKELGLGHKEIVYQKALAIEFKKKNLKFEREKQIPVIYEQKKVGVYVPDFVIEDKIIIELKALIFTGAKEEKQLWTYLKGSKYRLALLVNFGPRDVEISRVVYDTARNPEDGSAKSASSPRQSASIPHLLSMTATPIPRTLALTIYGDLDLSLLDELPAGRKAIKTEIVTPDKRDTAYELIRAEVKAGRQAYVICPRIEDALTNADLTPTNATKGPRTSASSPLWSAAEVKSAKTEAIRLQEKIFPEFEIGLLHSKLKPKDKEQVLTDFGNGKINILVSTSVIEVGVNFPNATVIAIEGAERFGLAQLHQLRGRVLRSSHQAYCFIFSDTKSQVSVERLKALVKAKSGFDLAELDLSLRGAGSLSAGKQWGLSDLGMEALKNLKMVELARSEAQKMIAVDPQLKKYPLIAKRLENQKKPIHFE